MLVTSTSAAASVTPGPAMHKARAFFTVDELLNGDVLVAGGFDVGATFTGEPFTAFDRPGTNVDIYDPANGTWTSGGTLSSPRAGHSGVLLRGNRGVLVIGGLAHPPIASATTDIIQ